MSIFEGTYRQRSTTTQQQKHETNNETKDWILKIWRRHQDEVFRRTEQ